MPRRASGTIRIPGFGNICADRAISLSRLRDDTCRDATSLRLSGPRSAPAQSPRPRQGVQEGWLENAGKIRRITG